MGRIRNNRPTDIDDDTPSNLTTAARIIAYLEKNFDDPELLLTAEKIHAILEPILQGKTRSEPDESGAQNQ